MKLLNTAIDLGTGVGAARVSLPREMFYRTLSEQSGFDVGDDGDLMSLLTKLAGVKTEYDKVAGRCGMSGKRAMASWCRESTN